MKQVFAFADVILRGREDPSSRNRWKILRYGGIIVGFGAFYGAVMGTFSATSADRLIQIFYSAAKVPLLLLLTGALSLPSYFVINTLVGLRKDFPQMMSAIAGAQAALTIILSSFAPITAAWYFSNSDYNAAILFNGVMFAIATLAAQIVLRRACRPLIARDPRHRWMIRVWGVVYAFVGIQLGWVLRPFVGSPYTTPSFLREGAFTNAYIAVYDLARDAFLRLLA